MRMRREGTEFEALWLLRTFVGALPPSSGLWRGRRPPPDPQIAPDRSHSMRTAESDHMADPRIGESSRYTRATLVRRLSQARTFIDRKTTSQRSFPSQVATPRRPSAPWRRPCSVPRATSRLGGPSVHQCSHAPQTCDNKSRGEVVSAWMKVGARCGPQALRHESGSKAGSSNGGRTAGAAGDGQGARPRCPTTSNNPD